MKPQVWFFLHLVVGGLVLSGESFGNDLKIVTSPEKNFQAVALSAICDVKCLNISKDCKTKCQRTPQNVTVLNEEARANSNLICRSGKGIVMTQNPGTFVIERLFADNTTDVLFATSEKFWWTFPEIGRSYRYRFHRVFSQGISKPEVTPEILGVDDTNRIHMPVKNISVEFVDSYDSVPGNISAEISFDPTEDHTCYYRVSCHQENGGYESVKDTQHLDVFRFRFDDLPLNSNFTVTVHRKLTNVHDVNASYHFTTPSILQGKGDYQARIVARASLIGATVASISILGFAGCCFFRFRRQLKPFQTTTRYSKVDKYEVSRERLTTTRVLGKGAFGVVKLGILRDDQGQTSAVAVKMLRDDSIPGDVRNFKFEIELVKSVGKHPNIVSFLGCCTIGPHPLIVMEYCSRGDLQSFLRAALIKSTASVVAEPEDLSVPSPKSSGPIIPLQKNFSDLSETISGGDDHNMLDCDPFTSQGAVHKLYAIANQVEIVTMMDMLNYGRQIATGMEFLSLKRVVHRDLAARNILVCDNGIVKISDFGMSRDVYLETVYRKRGIGRMPLKWMAIEALTHQVFSTCSDVWSFGVLLWEIVTMGGDPYPGIPTIDILSFLVSGNRMERPESCSIPLYDVMLSCWHVTPQNRPSFTVLRQELDELISANADNDYVDVNDIPVIVTVGDEN